MRSRAEQFLLALQDKMPQLRDNWDPAMAQVAYESVGGRGGVREAGEEPLQDAERRLHSKRELCKRYPPQLPVRNLSTSDPNAVVLHIPADDSYAIGVDHALLAWVMAAFNATLLYSKDDVLARKLGELSYGMILQKIPPGYTMKALLGLASDMQELHVRSAQWSSTTVPLTIAVTEFALAHELGHIESGHFSSGDAATLRGLSSSPIVCSVFGSKLEHEADEWGLRACHESAQRRPLDEQDSLLMAHWRVQSETALRDAWRRTLDIGTCLFFLLTELLDDLFPDRARITERSHPSGTARINHLGLESTVLGRSERPELQLAQKLVERLQALRANDDWRSQMKRWHST